MNETQRCTYWVSNKGERFDYKTYTNHGLGGVYRGFHDLPKDGYPYTFEFKETESKNHTIKSKPIMGVHSFETCGSKENPHMNDIKIQGTFEDAKIKLKELRKEDDTIGLRLIFNNK